MSVVDPRTLDHFDRIVFDAKLMRPACVLLQVAYGGISQVAHLFPTESWLIAPTDDLHVYPLRPGELVKLIAMVKKRTNDLPVANHRA